MSAFEDDLRTALRPLAGDPNLVALGVLGHLPAPRPRLAVRDIVVIAASAAAGVLLGLVVAYRFLDTPAHPESTPVAAVVPEAPARVSVAIGRVVSHDVGGSPNERALATFSTLQPGDLLETGADAMAELVLADGSVLRLNSDSALRIGKDDELDLERGQLWAQFESGPRRIRNPQGNVECEDAAVLDVSSRKENLAVVALSGSARLITPDAMERRVRSMQRVAIRGGVLRDREMIYWPYETLHWHLDLLCGTRSPAEIEAIAMPLLKTLSNSSEYSFGTMALRQMGECAMRPLFDFIENTHPTRDVEARMRAAEILADTATYRGIERMFDLLGDGCPGVRGCMYRAIARVSSIDVRNEEFWSEAPPSERAQAIREWRDRLELK